MEAFTLSRVIEQQRTSGASWLECLHVPALSVGIYALPAGAEDPQAPHTEDEIYYVVSDTPVEPGSILFVGAGVKHRFHAIEEDLTTLVFFAPAVGSRAQPKR
ncbi:MAG: cupin domain-containing protein [Candidatus Rokubacteria bacterium]|nr:cupin domain-containing protein [Candidatus Rokubacteria bacterium]